MQTKYFMNLTNHFARCVLFFGLLTQGANAAFINFDDLPTPSVHPWTCYIEARDCMHEIGNEYESKGIIFNGDREWLVDEIEEDGSRSNALQGFNGIAMEFIDHLPTFISFNIDSPTKGEASYFHVYGDNNELLFVQRSSGWTGVEETSSLYVPAEFISIRSTVGIKYIYIESLYNLRTGPVIDNLTFEYRTVPEPSTVVLLVLSLAGIFWRRNHSINPRRNF